MVKDPIHVWLLHVSRRLSIMRTLEVQRRTVSRDAAARSVCVVHSVRNVPAVCAVHAARDVTPDIWVVLAVRHGPHSSEYFAHAVRDLSAV